jgi:hypothetical protein
MCQPAHIELEQVPMVCLWLAARGLLEGDAA